MVLLFLLRGCGGGLLPFLALMMLAASSRQITAVRQQVKMLSSETQQPLVRSSSSPAEQQQAPRPMPAAPVSLPGAASEEEAHHADAAATGITSLFSARGWRGAAAEEGVSISSLALYGMVGFLGAASLVCCFAGQFAPSASSRGRGSAAAADSGPQEEGEAAWSGARLERCVIESSVALHPASFSRDSGKEQTTRFSIPQKDSKDSDDAAMYDQDLFGTASELPNLQRKQRSSQDFGVVKSEAMTPDASTGTDYANDDMMPVGSRASAVHWAVERDVVKVKSVARKEMTGGSNVPSHGHWVPEEILRRRKSFQDPTAMKIGGRTVTLAGVDCILVEPQGLVINPDEYVSAGLVIGLHGQAPSAHVIEEWDKALRETKMLDAAISFLLPDIQEGEAPGIEQLQLLVREAVALTRSSNCVLVGKGWGAHRAAELGASQAMVGVISGVVLTGPGGEPPAAIVSEKAPLKPGDLVDAVHSEDGQRYGATIVNKVGPDRYQLKWEDEEYGEDEKQRNLILRAEAGCGMQVPCMVLWSNTDRVAPYGGRSSSDWQDALESADVPLVWRTLRAGGHEVSDLFRQGMGQAGADVLRFVKVAMLLHWLKAPEEVINHMSSHVSGMGSSTSEQGRSLSSTSLLLADFGPAKAQRLLEELPSYIAVRLGSSDPGDEVTDTVAQLLSSEGATRTKELLAAVLTRWLRENLQDVAEAG